MKWLADNYKWLFDRIGALVIIGVVGYLLRRFRRAAEPAYHLEQPERQEKTDGRADLRAEDSQVQPERFNPNIRMTGAGIASVSERGRGVWKEDVQGTEQAILIQFTNEAQPGVRNVGGLVKAALVYKNAVRVRLTNANTGDFLYEGEFRMALNPLGIVAEDLLAVPARPTTRLTLNPSCATVRFE